MSSEAKVGLITFLSLIFLGVVLQQLGYFKGKERGYPLHIIFKDASGIGVGTPVRLSGVNAGKVKALTLTPENYALATLTIREGVTVKKKSTFMVTGGFIGERWIEIVPSVGVQEKLEPGETVRGESIPSFTELMSSGYEAVTEFKRTLSTFNKSFGDPKFIASIHSTVDEMRSTLSTLEKSIKTVSNQASRSVASITNHLDSLLSGIEGDVKGISKEAYGFSKNLHQISDENKEEIRTLVQNLRTASEDLKKTLEAIRKLAVDEKTTDDLREIIRSSKAVADRAEKISKDLEEFIGDREMKSDIKSTIHDARAVFSTTRKILDPLKKAFPDGKGESKEPFKFSRWDVQAEWEAHAVNPVTSLGMELFPSSSRSYILGVRDIGGANTFNIQVGNAVGKRDRARLGVIESHLGFGYDKSFSEHLGISFDLYNPKHATLNVYTYIKAYQDWELKLGVRDLFDQNRGVIGIRKRF